MANNETLGASFSIDVTDLKAGLSQANKLIRESESEFKAAAAGMDDWSSSQDGLEAKIKSLNSIADLQRKKVDALQNEYDRLIAEGLDPTSAAAVELRTKINNETTALNKSEQELKKQKQALENLGDESEDAAEATDDVGDSFSGLKAAGGVAVKAIAAVGAACASAVTAFFGLAESTREAREDMSKLTSAYEGAGLAAETATAVHTKLYGVMGENDTAVEAAQQIALLASSEEEAAKWAEQAANVTATFGDALKPETYFESANETMKLGEATGAFAQMLEGTGYSVEEFNEQLAACTTEEEKHALMLEISQKQMGKAGDAYRKNNADIIAAQEAQAELNEAINELGAIAEPLMTTLKQLATGLLTSLTPFVSLIGGGLKRAFEGADGAADMLAEGLTGIITTLLEKIVEVIPFVIQTIVAVVPQLLTALLAQLPTILQTLISIVLQCINALSAMLPTIVAAIMEVLPQLINSLIAAIPQLLEAAITLLMAIVDAIPTIINELIAALPSIIDTTINALLESIPLLLQAAIDLLMAVVDAIPTIINALTENLPKIISTIISGIIAAIPMLLDAAITLLMAIVDAIPVILDAVIENLPTIIDAIINGVLDALPLLLDAAITLFFAIIEAIPTIVMELTARLPQIIETILKSLVNAAPRMFSTATSMLGKIIDAVKDLVKKLPSKMSEIITSIVNGLTKGISKITTVGSDIVKGLWEGIKDMAGWIGDKIKGFGESILGGIKDFFGIASPSKVMADEVGKNLALGIGEGFEDNIAGVNKEITKAMDFNGNVGVVGAVGSGAARGVVVNQNNYYSQAHSRLELYKTKQNTAAAVRLALNGA